MCPGAAENGKAEETMIHTCHKKWEDPMYPCVSDACACYIHTYLGRYTDCELDRASAQLR